MAISRLIPRGKESSMLLITSSGRLIAEVNLEAGASSIAWSPDSRFVAVGLDNGRLSVMSRDGFQAWTTRAGLALRYGDELSSAAWSPDSSRIVAGLASSVLVCYDSSGRELWRSNPLGTPIHSVDWSQTGLAAAGGDWVAALNSTGAVLWLRQGYGRAIREVRWSLKGDRLAVLAYRWLLILSPGGDIILSTGLLPDSATVMEWSPNFGVVAVGGLFGVATFVASPVHVSAPWEVTAPEGRLSLNLTLENKAPAAVEVALTVSLDGSLVERGEIQLPPGESNVSLAMDVPLGDHLLEIECRSPGGVHATSTKVVSLESPRLRTWALHSPGGPVRIVLAITNPNPIDVPIRIAVLDRGVEIHSEGGSLPPGLTYRNMTLSLDPGVHRLRIRILDSAGTVMAEYNLSAAVVGPSIPLRLETPTGVKLGSAEIGLSVSNPYPLPLNVTLECFVDSSLVLQQNVTIEEGGSRVFSVRAPAGEHVIYARALFGGSTLAEDSVKVSVVPLWFPVLAIGAALALTVLAVSRSAPNEEEILRKLISE
ncbi:MAG TPA: WD40 repeat domain-containing protein [Candidatus Korarchaeota archaeon]|nr:WD40 repeat domain-containing protein [Candidatus Korarchaeota archaeon]